MPKELNFDKHNLNIAMSEVKDLFRMHFEQGCRYVAKRVCERILALDFEAYIRADRHQRTSRRRGYRNGYRHRNLLTAVGLLDLKIPRDREGRFRPTLFRRCKRVEKNLDDLIRCAFISGVSTDKVGEVLDVLCGHRVSASYVSTVTKELDSAVKDFNNSPLEDDFVFLFLDALTVKIRFELKVKSVKLLVAYGIRKDGKRSLISFQRAPSESAACWRTFLDNLHVRGLKGRNLKLIILDGAPGLWSSVAEVYPLIEHQLCWVHKLRNVASYCPKRYRQECVSQATQIMYARAAGVAANRFRAWKQQWKTIIPKAVSCLEKDFDRLIPFFVFPQKIHKMIRTTNVIERCFREVRRRLKVMGYFQNSKSCDRIIYAIFNYFNCKWKRNCRRIKAIEEIFRKAA